MKYSEELKGKGDPRHSLVEYAALNVVDLENEVAADIVRLVELVSDIQATIRKIDSSECRLLLEMRYLSFMDWDEIAARLNCTSRNVFYLHKKALSKVKVA